MLSCMWLGIARRTRVQTIRSAGNGTENKVAAKSKVDSNSTEMALMYAQMQSFITDGRWMELFESGQTPETVGRGSFGVAARVKLAAACGPTKPVVVKAINLASYQRKTGMTHEESAKMIANELKIQISLGSHPNIMGIFDYAPRSTKDWYGGSVYIMMPEARGGDLDTLYAEELERNMISPGMIKSTMDWVRAIGVSGESHKYRNLLIAQIAIDVTRGLKYMHEQDYIHADIKPGNVWASDKNCLHATAACKYMLGDFGMSAPAERASKITGGTRFFMPPELPDSSASRFYKPSAKRGWSKAGDVFSLGVTLLDLLTMGEHLWDKYGARIMTRPESVLYHSVEGLTPLLAELVAGMLRGEPRHRHTAAEAHTIAERAFVDIAMASARMPETDVAPACVEHCVSMQCCYSHHCSLTKRTCQRDNTTSSVGWAWRFLPLAWTAQEPDVDRVCYGHNMAPPKPKSQFPLHVRFVRMLKSRIKKLKHALGWRTPTLNSTLASNWPTPSVVQWPEAQDESPQPDLQLLIGDAVKFYSNTYRQWIDCNVVDTFSAYIKIDCKPESWIGPEEQALRVRKIISSLPTPEAPEQEEGWYLPEDEVQFYSTSENRWIDCQVTHAKSGSIVLDCRPTRWLSPEEQRVQVRERPIEPDYWVGCAVQYHTPRNGKWIDCRIKALSASSMELDCRPGQPLSPEQWKIMVQPKYKPGDSVLYHSVSRASWILCEVSSVDRFGNLWLSESCGTGFLPPQQQKLKLALLDKSSSIY